MTTKNTTHPFIEYATKTRAAIAEAATLAARAEAALVCAEQEQAIAIKDDGKIDPTALYTRTEAAKKNTALRKIEANRAGAKLSELEEQYHIEVERSAQGVAKELEAAAEKTKLEVIAKLATQVVPDLADDSGLYAAANCFVGVADRNRAADLIKGLHTSHISFDGNIEDLSGAIEKGAALL